MLELPTIETDFLFENSQDFNQTTHARPQHPIVFIHNISLYRSGTVNSKSFVGKVLLRIKWKFELTYAL